MNGIPDADELASYTIHAQHPATRGWVEDRVRLRLLAAEHELDVQLAVDGSIAALRAERFAPGRPAEMLLNRWVPVDADLRAMLSMRYEGGDPGKPFVDASPLSRAFVAADLGPLGAAARRAFGSLRPRYLRLWSARPAGSFPGTGSDKRFMAAPLTTLRAVPADVPPVLTMRRATSLAGYPAAERAYRAVRADHPDHVEQAGLQSSDDLTETLEAGLLFEVLVGDEWAGYVAVATTGEAMLGLPAYVVQELVLAPEHRGRGYGAHLTTLVARALPNERPVLLGTIHADNRGALTAATAAGRIDVGGWLQLPLEPDPLRESPPTPDAG